MKGCRSACVEEFKAIMEFTGWSQNTVFAVFFVAIFILLLLLVSLLYKFSSRKSRKYRRSQKYRRNQTK